MNASTNYTSTINKYALTLNGTNQYGIITSGTPPTLDASLYNYTIGTIECWMKTSSSTASKSILTKYGAFQGLFIVNHELVGYLSGFIYTGVTIDDGAWHHVALSFNSGVTNGYRIYVDGVFKYLRQKQFHKILLLFLHLCSVRKFRHILRLGSLVASTKSVYGI